MAKININLSIAGKSYPMSIEQEKEELYREAARRSRSKEPATGTGLGAADKFINIGSNASSPHGFLIALRTVQLNYIGTTLV